MAMYEIRFNTCVCASTWITAPSLEHAVVAARAMDVSRLDLRHPSGGPQPHEIIVVEPFGGQWVWRSDHHIMQLGVEQLYIAASNLLLMMKDMLASKNTDHLVRSSAQDLRNAIERVEGDRS